jgi:uncharacterized protein involved in exopolysaccharide biosynthesis
MRDSFTKTIDDSYRTIGKQLEALDAQMQQELTRAIEQLGTHLASLSRKFVDDYSPLTERLRTLVAELGNSR